MHHGSVHARRQKLPIVHVGELFRPAANFKNSTPKKALKWETPFKMLHGEETDLLHLRIIGVRSFVLIKDS